MKPLLNMFMKSVLWLLFVQGALCSPREIEKRASCNADNLLRTLRATSNLADSVPFCSKYIHVPYDTTVTVTAGTSTATADDIPLTQIDVHPLNLYNLQHEDGRPRTPITYNSASPSPSMVPGDPQDYYGPSSFKIKDRSPDPTAGPSLERKASAAPTTTISTPKFIASTYPPSRISSACSCLTIPAAYTWTSSTPSATVTTTPTCTYYNVYPWTRVPAFCAPSLQVNAATLVSPPPAVKTSTPTPVSDKLSCCALCAQAFNCVWWNFSFGTPGNGWAPGTCRFGYNTGVVPNIGDGDNDGPPTCPNGAYGSLTSNRNFSGKEGANNLPGYNDGPCGGGYPYQSSQDYGYPDDDPSGNNARIC